MTDLRELLKLAALACGFEIAHNTGLVTRKDTGRYWNPAEDDGDCARMEAQLLMHIKFGTSMVEAYTIGANGSWLHEWYVNHSDRNAARRLASLRVAAEIGKRIREAQG